MLLGLMLPVAKCGGVPCGMWEAVLPPDIILRSYDMVYEIRELIFVYFICIIDERFKHKNEAT